MDKLLSHKFVYFDKKCICDLWLLPNKVCILYIMLPWHLVRLTFENGFEQYTTGNYYCSKISKKCLRKQCNHNHLLYYHILINYLTLAAMVWCVCFYTLSKNYQMINQKIRLKWKCTLNKQLVWDLSKPIIKICVFLFFQLRVYMRQNNKCV